MLDSFTSYFDLPPLDPREGEPPEKALVGLCGGQQLLDGLLTIPEREESIRLCAAINRAFPRLGGAFSLFAYTWRGTGFALTRWEGLDSDNVVMFFPDRFLCQELPMPIERFLDMDVASGLAAYLEEDGFDQWCDEGGRLAYGMCAGYDDPLLCDGMRDKERPPLEAMPIQPYWDHAAEVVGMRERHAGVWTETALRFWEPPLF